MNKRTVLCSLVFAVCVFYSSPAFAQGVPLAQQVFRKHNRTLQRADVQEVLPQILEGLKAPDTQARLNPQTINAVVNNPDLLPIFIPDIEPRFVALLKRDQELKNFLRDPLVQRLLQSPAAIDALAGLLNVGVPEPGPKPNLPDLPAQQIYNQEIHSVIWIHTGDSLGSGVLIDKARRLAVTNQHVIVGAETVGVVFPYRQNGEVMRDRNFYLGDNNFQWLRNKDYITNARIITQNVENDLAIIQLNRLPPTAREIKHDFTRNVEDSMRRGDRVHILGNPGERLWNWTKGDFVESEDQNCLPSGGACLVLESDIHGGNSGGPVLNGQGILVGIITATDDETAGYAAPARNVKALLSTIPANLTTVQRIYPKRVFKIRNRTGVSIHYQIRWSNSNNWQRNSLKTGFIRTHLSNGQNIPSDYPKILFDHIAGDQWFTGKTYRLGTTLLVGENADGAPTYFFRYNHRGDRLDLYRDRDAGAAPTLSKAVPKENALFANYPNPFNPETWIPYQLAEPAEVKVVIYAADGTLVRTLSLGYQAAGMYQSKGRAAYWDGENELGEPVASGLYFYTLKVSGEFTATRKMLIQK